MKRNKVITKLKNYYLKNKRLPTYREMSKMFSFSSPNASYELAERLVKEGILGKDGRRLFPKGLLNIPHLGVIKAGYPVSAESIDGDSVDLYNYILSIPNNVFSLTVKGDSMIDVGINEGDLAIIDRNREPVIGDIVAATIDGECTLKILSKKDGKIYLDAANDKYKSIYPLQSLKIDGVLINVIRKYH